jgi:hypothetical protein
MGPESIPHHHEHREHSEMRLDHEDIHEDNLEQFADQESHQEHHAPHEPHAHFEHEHTTGHHIETKVGHICEADCPHHHTNAAPHDHKEQAHQHTHTIAYKYTEHRCETDCPEHSTREHHIETKQHVCGPDCPEHKHRHHEQHAEHDHHAHSVETKTAEHACHPDCPEHHQSAQALEIESYAELAASFQQEAQQKQRLQREPLATDIKPLDSLANTIPLEMLVATEESHVQAQVQFEIHVTKTLPTQEQPDLQPVQTSETPASIIQTEETSIPESTESTYTEAVPFVTDDVLTETAAVEIMEYTDVIAAEPIEPEATTPTITPAAASILHTKSGVKETPIRDEVIHLIDDLVERLQAASSAPNTQDAVVALVIESAQNTLETFRELGIDDPEALLHTLLEQRGIYLTDDGSQVQEILAQPASPAYAEAPFARHTFIATPDPQTATNLLGSLSVFLVVTRTKLFLQFGQLAILQPKRSVSFASDGQIVRYSHDSRVFAAS